MFGDIGDSILGFLEAVLTFLHDLVEPVFGVHSWGWAIILLTLIVRVLLLPLAIKQTRSMRAMQAIQPRMKEIQSKYKVDRELMRKDPERYRAKKQKMNEEMMALYQEEGVNPAASCLPLLAQAPVFIALFWAIQGMEELRNAPFYFFTEFISTEAGEGFVGLGALVSAAGWPGWLLIAVMSGTMFITQKQMMARTAATNADNPMAQQQKILLYVMPVFLAVISFQFMLGLLLYWVTTNIWQIVQQWVILRDVRSESAGAEQPRNTPGAGGTGSATSGKRPGKGTNDPKGPKDAKDPKDPKDPKGTTKPAAGDPSPDAGGGPAVETGSGERSGSGGTTGQRSGGKGSPPDRPSKAKGPRAGGSRGPDGRAPRDGHLPKRGRSDRT
ncbi:MAG: YidC/Oxa1 family membrane protein insertase [Nitriliruptoraceae bacterium]